MKEMPTIPKPTTTIFFLLVFSGISSFISNSATLSGRTLASGSFHSLLLMAGEKDEELAVTCKSGRKDGGSRQADDE